jgi:glycosyltransferase involved in cell wall biosynthesis
MDRLKVLIAHEWLVSYAGSERCVEQLHAEFPGAQIVTTLFDPERLPKSFAGAKPSLLQRIPGALHHHEWLLPLMPAAWRLRRRFTNVDAVVSSSHACAKAVRVARNVAHISYCHTPMRYAWEYELEEERFPKWTRPLVRPLMFAMRRWDKGKAQKVDTFCANSSEVADRIRKHYGRDATVVFPPVDTDFFTPSDNNKREDYFVFAARLVSYKRPDLVVEAFANLPDLQLRVIGSGPMDKELRALATPNVTFLGAVSDEELREQYRRAKAMVFCAQEDFGIVMAEAHACGTPVIALAKGGALDIVEEGVNGWLIAGQDVSLLRDAICVAADANLDATTISKSAQRFSQGRYRREMREIVEATVARKLIARS